MIAVEERTRRMKHAFQCRLERERQKEPKVVAMRKKPKGKLTFYDIECVSGREEVRQ